MGQTWCGWAFAVPGKTKNVKIAAKLSERKASYGCFGKYQLKLRLGHSSQIFPLKAQQLRSRMELLLGSVRRVTIERTDLLADIATIDTSNLFFYGDLRRRIVLTLNGQVTEALAGVKQAWLR